MYPELPAALAVMAAVAAATAPLSRKSAAVFVGAVVVLPWLAVKYVPVAAVLVVVALWRWRHQLDRTNRRWLAAVVAALAFAGAAYLIMHRWLYGGWTSYAAGGYFGANGELSVLVPSRTTPVDPAVSPASSSTTASDWRCGCRPGCSCRLPSAVLWRRRPSGAGLLLLPLGAGWFVAAFVALTMHGWWWPGRQVVVVLPLAVVAVAVAVDAVPAARWVFVPVAVLGVTTWGWTTIEAITRRHVLVVDFERTGNPWIQAWRLVLPDGRSQSPADAALLAAWTVAIAALGWAGWRYLRTSADPANSAPGEVGGDGGDGGIEVGAARRETEQLVTPRHVGQREVRLVG